MSTTPENIEALLRREPFVPMSSGKTSEVAGPNSAALLKSDVFVVFTDGERWAHVPDLHIASIETLANGRGRRGARRRPR